MIGWFYLPVVVMAELQLPVYSTNESAGSVNVCVVLSQSTERDVSLMITTASETAIGTAAD